VTDPSGTRVEDFLFQGFNGTINDSTDFFEGTCISDPCWYYVPVATGREVVIFDLYAGNASNIVAKDIYAVTQDSAPVTVMCDPKAISSDVGFKCWNGDFVRTKVGISEQ